VLSLLSLLSCADHGLRADEVAEALGKSTSTAYCLLDTLCQEGFVVHAVDGVHHLTGQGRSLVPAARGTQLPRSLDGVLDELFTRTHKRVYLTTARSGQVVIPLVRGRQGMPLIPGLGSRIGENAHALALRPLLRARMRVARGCARRRRRACVGGGSRRTPRLGRPPVLERAPVSGLRSRPTTTAAVRPIYRGKEVSA
jgi:hypothetical protein